jgi:hypothetical protein
MTTHAAEVERSLALLADTPRQIAAMTRDLGKVHDLALGCCGYGKKGGRASRSARLDLPLASNPGQVAFSLG